MEITINNKNYHLSYDHIIPERLSQLKKMKCVKVSFECNKDIEPDYNDLLIISKSNFYHWVFTDCEVINKKYFTKKYNFQNSEKEVQYIKIEFTFKEVYGSNNKTLIEREIKLNNLFS